MNAHTLPVNRHPVDLLAETREKIKALQAEEDMLRTEVSVLMGSADALGGDEYVAKQSISTRAGAIDADALKRAGIDVERFRKKPSTVYTIKCERRVLEDA